MLYRGLSPLFQRGFSLTGRALLWAQFHGLFLDRDSELSLPAIENLLDHSPFRPIFYSTHSSWWDPIVAAFLSVEKLGLRTLTLIDQKQLEKYVLLQKCGFIGVSQAEGPKVEELLKREFFEEPSGGRSSKKKSLWLTPTGVFSPLDVSVPVLKPGIFYFSKALQPVIRIPVAMDYQILQTARPLIFLRIGPAQVFDAASSREEDLETLRETLEKTSNSLKEKVRLLASLSRPHIESSFERIGP